MEYPAEWPAEGGSLLPYKADIHFGNVTSEKNPLK
jgi:hypothetical protein